MVITWKIIGVVLFIYALTLCSNWSNCNFKSTINLICIDDMIGNLTTMTERCSTWSIKYAKIDVLWNWPSKIIIDKNECTSPYSPNKYSMLKGNSLNDATNSKKNMFFTEKREDWDDKSNLISKYWVILEFTFNNSFNYKLT